MKKDIKIFFIGTSVILIYLLASNYCHEIINLLGIDYYNLNITLKSICLALYETILLLIIIYILFKDFVPNLKTFLQNNISYFKKYIKYWFIMLVLMICSNLIISTFFTNSIADNQEIILETLKVAPLYTFYVTVFIAPFLEELVFRMAFRKLLPYSNKLFILFSGLIFGALHVVTNLENLVDLLYIIPYSIPGFIFAYVYTKSKNIMVPISLHFLHNGIMMSLQILLLLVS